MLKLNILIKYYLYLFLFIDAMSGFIRVYIGITNPIFNVGFWVRGPLVFILIFYYLYQLKQKKLYIDEFFAILILCYFIFNLLLNYLINPSVRMISENILKLMMDNSYIINSSRSEIIDEKALVRMLQEKKIAGAGLDVFGAEKKLKTELLDLPNTILIPHMGSATVEGRIEMGEKVIVNIKTFIDGHNPPNRII